MTWILVGGAVVCAWAMLRTMGGERERRIVEQSLANPPKSEELPPQPPAPAQRPSTAQQPQQRRPRQAA
jgi:hypothetical protein